LPKSRGRQTPVHVVKIRFIEIRTMLTQHPTSVGAARRFVRDVLMSRQVPDTVVDTVELLTSEVVTNAILHGQSGPQLAVTVEGSVVRVAVQDRSPALPVRRLTHLDDVSGRGVVIVEELATAWGVERERNGSKRVWFEVAC
jgi:anti-sigma regulatory factor (Ser/Thr protein kinase)